ncbi:MAG: OmpA family protein [Myxococcales bacterium]|nr:OmpA family protein [Myxococcales bacterium]
MARKKKHPEHVNHERWLVSYADFITLLFAFFVVMFAVSQVDSKKVGRFTEAFSKAVGIDVFPMSGDSLMAGGRTPDALAEGPAAVGAMSVLDDLHATLTKMAENNDALQGLQVIKMRHELVLRLPEGVFFDSGDARVKDATGRMLKILTPELTKRELEVRVEGHTDNRPVAAGGRFRSNWDLSTERAGAVMVILQGEGMKPERLSIAGYAEFRPIAPNTTDEGRKQNRRVDLVVTAIVKDDRREGEQGDDKSDPAGAEDPKAGEAKTDAKSEGKSVEGKPSPDEKTDEGKAKAGNPVESKARDPRAKDLRTAEARTRSAKPEDRKP